MPRGIEFPVDEAVSLGIRDANSLFCGTLFTLSAKNLRLREEEKQDG